MGYDAGIGKADNFHLDLTHVLNRTLAVSAGSDGVIDMELLSVIRRWALRDRLSIREISRRTGLSRNTIRKYLRSEVIEPKFKVPERSSKLVQRFFKSAHIAGIPYSSFLF